jgi:hypothetical protein
MKIVLIEHGQAGQTNVTDMFKLPTYAALLPLSSRQNSPLRRHGEHLIQALECLGL